ncbi:hypothetical protein G6F43_011809 [Rhizopus delemar]|nr:hypothetical protein G6F43_011809 [Rhizopus delemar]
MTRRHLFQRLSRLFRDDKHKDSEKVEIDELPRLSTSSFSGQLTISTCDTSSFIEPPVRLGLADQVKLILGDAIEIADQEIEREQQQSTY